MGTILDLDAVVSSERRFLESGQRGFYRLDPRLKLAILTGVIILNIGLAIPVVSAVLLAIGLLLVLWSRPPIGRTMAFYVAPLLATAVAVFGFSIGFGRTPAWQVGRLVVYREGLLLGGGVALRVYCDISWLALTFITTPFSKVLETLRWYRLPTILVDTLALMYRYSFLLYAEFTRMRAAAMCRGGCADLRSKIRTLSMIAAQLFMRSYDRSEQIYCAQLARGGSVNE